MHEQLARLLQRSEPIGTFTTKWGDGTIDLLVADYLSAKLPPTELIMSVRAVLLRGQEVLVVSEPNGPYILPGGRREAGETLLQTLQREIGEETGWAIDNVTLLGFRHLHHLTPKPADYPYQYPDFCQAIYTAQARQYTPEAKQFDEYVLDSYFLPIAEAQALALTPGEHYYLIAAQEQEVAVD